MDAVRTNAAGVEVDEMTHAELADLIDREAREHFNMSGAEFTARWRSGHFENIDDPHLSDLAILLP